ncbi:hypothetical protein ACKRZS_009273 [Fusarium odoratissimum]|uniref:Uncharacterized protein n=3 Tax=Fusarium oxysporum species complex TaxID=171631 RepID=N1RKW7_FUSC4|nr:uncharacterized protein FOIG_06661 [Fusarium odoratissimum NRRL 54006]EMT66364.1 hypothetical protein FOC4_g10006768 [Fusarium odoratissimum]EXM02443.1 hypothetical protein FOIG_06661 [Fusarium odoratissimum NRRL 54006]KAK2133615.1 hypothetical protein NOF04DRAFT_1040361 [Fusarium oxysporum II5]TXC08514.1 hypothetical protein FocTR4_00003821 [Fusarium oxysporum f. sp. cubense]
MDLDIEMDDAVDTVHDAPILDVGRDDILQPDEPEEPGEVAEDEPPTDDSKTLIPTKIHIKGVDSLHTSDIKAYVKAHFGDVDRIEWIDDSSANLLFPSEPTARDAIVALSSVPVADATALAIGETLPAKPFEGKPEISLQVRFAIQSDKKEVGAALRSRYYLLHPEHDPEERRRRNQENRSRYRDRDDGYHRGGEGRRRRASDDDVETFEASMYDDAPRPTRRRRDSDIEERPRSYARENQGKELFSGRKSQRDRSASPRRDNDGDDLMGERASSSGNRTRARDLKDRISGSNNSKELFPTKKSIKQFGGGNLDTLERAIGSARLKDEDRPKIVSVPNARGDGNSFNIRGMASQQGSGEGFAIKGAASANARELFPTKLGSNNTGKELFGGGRSKQRQKAEDLFS